MNHFTNQEMLLEQIRRVLPKHVSLANELAETLHISTDSAYRRIRNKTSLTLEESIVLAQKYGISLDNLLQNKPDTMPFKYRGFDYNISNLEDYFSAILKEFEKIDYFGANKIIYSTKDLPMFYLFQFPALAAFKFFFWKKTLYERPEYQNKAFGLGEMDKDYLQIGAKVWDKYASVASTEIWSDHVLYSTLNPILYYWETGAFESIEVPLRLLDDLDNLLSHIEKQAQHGCKFHKNKPYPSSQNYELYYNDVIVTNNTIFLDAGHTKVVYLVQNAINFLITSNEVFGKETEDWLNGLIRKSTSISTHSEKVRKSFFRKMKGEVNKVRNKIS